jgi:hypothetical protein
LEDQRGWRRDHTSGLRREAKGHAALKAAVCPAKAVSPLRSATAVQILAAKTQTRMIVVWIE